MPPQHYAELGQGDFPGRNREVQTPPIPLILLAEQVGGRATASALEVTRIRRPAIITREMIDDLRTGTLNTSPSGHVTTRGKPYF